MRISLYVNIKIANLKTLVRETKMNIADHIMKARCQLLTLESFYGSMGARFQWKENNSLPTMAVSMQDGRVNCYYNSAFCLMFNTEELMGIIKHEVEHVVKLHPIRCYGRDPDLWNIACDQIVNGKKIKPRIDQLKKIESKIKSQFEKDCQKALQEGKIKTLPPKQTDHIIWMDKDTNDNITTEELYKQLETKLPTTPCPQCMKGQKGNKNQKGVEGESDGDGEGESDSNGEGDGDGEGEGEENNGKSSLGKEGGGGEAKGKRNAGKDGLKGKGGEEGEGDTEKTKDKKDTNTPHNLPCPDHPYKGFDDHKPWNKSNMSEDEARQMVKEMVNNAIKAGTAPNHLSDDIKKLNTAKVSWKHELKEFIARKAGGKRFTYARTNRRAEDSFGLKGRSSHARVPLLILVDTSGSVDGNRLMQFFTEIESMSKHFKIQVLTFTSQPWPPAYKYREGMWKTLKVPDRGGTCFTSVLNYAQKEKLIGQLTIMLTDGECTVPPPQPYNMIWALCPHDQKGFERMKDNFKWGKVIHITSCE